MPVCCLLAHYPLVRDENDGAGEHLRPYGVLDHAVDGIHGIVHGRRFSYVPFSWR